MLIAVDRRSGSEADPVLERWHHVVVTSLQEFVCVNRIT
jgi:hypothetical protein